MTPVGCCLCYYRHNQPIVAVTFVSQSDSGNLEIYSKINQYKYFFVSQSCRIIPNKLWGQAKMIQNWVVYKSDQCECRIVPLLHLLISNNFWCKIAKYTANHTSNKCPCQHRTFSFWSGHVVSCHIFHPGCCFGLGGHACELYPVLRLMHANECPNILRHKLSSKFQFIFDSLSQVHTQVRRCISLQNYGYEVQAS